MMKRQHRLGATRLSLSFPGKTTEASSKREAGDPKPCRKRDRAD